MSQESTEDKKVNLSKLSSRRRLLKVLLVILVIFFSLWLMAVLLSFDPSDPSWSQTAWHEPIHNLGGFQGAWLSDTLFFIFGVIAYTIPLIAIGSCWAAWQRYRHNSDYIDYFAMSRRLIGALALILTSCGLAAINADDIWYFASGGIIGNLLSTALLPKLHSSGSTIVLLLVWTAGLMLFTSWSSLVSIAEKTGSIALTILNFASNCTRRLRDDTWFNEDEYENYEQDEISLEPQQHGKFRYARILRGALTTPCQRVTDKFAKPLNCKPDAALFSGKRIAIDINVLPPKLATKKLDSYAPVPLQKEEKNLIHPFLMQNSDGHPPLQEPTMRLPSLVLLTPPAEVMEPVDIFALEQMARLIEARLAEFRIKVEVVNYSPGPVITRFELNLAPGVKAARISHLSRDLARSLSTVAVRVVEVIPGKPYVGLELPNKKRQTVYLREVLGNAKFRDNPSPLTVVLGKDIIGDPVVADLAKMPHLLVAGTTGSGKSVGINAMIMSMLYKAQPEDVRFIMIDPKMLELSVYEGIPHLLTKVVTDMKDAANVLHWSVNEMERRYKLMSVLGVRTLAGYNEKIAATASMGRSIPDPYWKTGDSTDAQHQVLKKLPYIVVFVDEFADLMMTVGKKVEELISRLAQKARAAGIHLVLATQRPSVDVITGLIKANIPTRIAFTVSSKIDSYTILDQSGAELLLGMGDMLYSSPNSTIPVRVHGAFVFDQEVHAVVQDWKARGRHWSID